MRFPRIGTLSFIGMSFTTICCTQSLHADPIYVDGSVSSSGNGLSWATAKKTVQEGIDAASAGDEVWVKGGITYKPGTTANSTFQLKNGVNLHGGFAGNETNRVDADPYFHPTILSGDDLDGMGAKAIHVVTAEDTQANLTRLDGFIIEDGDADGEDIDGHGGGLLVTATAIGTSRLTVTRCVFRNNNADTGGAAIACIRPFDSHQSVILTLDLVNCEFHDNTASNGGAMFIQGAPVLTTNCLFYDNHADANGGAIYIEWDCDELKTCDERLCLAPPNESEAILQNCTLADNTADGEGGGVYVRRYQILTSVSSILWGNEHDSDGTPTANQIALEGTCPTVQVTYSCVQGGHSGTGNISSDPEFVNPSATPPNYRLDSSTPCMDAGAFTGNFPSDHLDFDHDGTTTGELAPDLDRRNRIINGTIDMGAFEKTCECLADFVTSGTFQPPPDGEVDGADLAFLLGEWGPGTSDADIVTSATFQPPPDGDVDGADLAYLLGDWGVCPEDCDEEEGLMGGGESEGGPFAGTEIGDLLDQLLEEDDEEAAAALAAELLELLME